MKQTQFDYMRKKETKKRKAALEQSNSPWTKEPICEIKDPSL